MASGGDNPERVSIDWKKRCLTLEASLLKFKEQAVRIRALLGSKIEELEKRCARSDERSEIAERENRDLQEKLESVHPKPDDADEKLQTLEKKLAEKEFENEELREQIQEQKQLRMQDTQTIEDKTAQIRQWVISRLRELELQNDALKYERSHLIEKIDILQNRLHSLPTSIVREIYQSDEQHGFGQSPRCSSRNDPIVRPSSVMMDLFQKEELLSQDDDPSIDIDGSDDTDDISSPLDANGNISEDLENEPEYQEIDENHESKYEPLRTTPPRIKIERKIFHSPTLHDSVISSNSEDYLLGSLTPRRSHNNSPIYDQTPVEAKYSAIVSQFQRQDKNLYPANTSCTSCGSVQQSRNVSAIATLPRVRHDKRNSLKLGVKSPFLKGDSPDNCKKDDELSSQMECDSDGTRSRISKPPTPPLHRRPSWENRIYAVANIGMQYDINHGSSSPESPGDQIYQDFNVPVYTYLKGHAALIRSKPFSGESSSESSDNEEICDITTASSTENEAVMTVAGPSGFTTSVTVIGTMNHSGATKRIVSSMSSESSDYCLPPDDDISIVSTDIDNSEPEYKLLKYAAQGTKKELLQKSGYLTKLGGKVKNWRRKWFVLQQGELFYYKTESDVLRKPQGHVFLDSYTKISKSEGANTFEIITSNKTYYLNASTAYDMDEWIRAIQNVLKRKAAYSIIQQGNSKIVMKGWITKCKHGLNRRVWCVLIGKYLVYYRSQSDKTPAGQIHLTNARVEEIDSAWDSDEETETNGIVSRFTIVVWPSDQGPVYLVIPSKPEKDSWLYYMTVASGGGMGNIGTDYEQLISKLLSMEGDPNAIYWKHPNLLVTKEPICCPLTMLPTDELKARALDLFKSCHLFMNVAIESPAIDYHVSLAQNILHTCLQFPELQSEIYAQLIKQTSRHPPQQKHLMQNILLCGSHSWFLCDASTTSPTASTYDLTDSKLNPSSQVFIQGWQLLAMCIALFLPRQGLLWYLKAHLQRYADSRSDVGKYAIFCQRSLERASQNGSRENRPSRLEVLSILLRNPYHHSLPISIPIHFMNGTYQVVSFDGFTTVQEVVQSLTKLVGLHDSCQSGFALYSDDPSGNELHHHLQFSKKLCDVISQWEQTYLDQQREKDEVSRTIKLIYKNRLYFRSMMKWETEKEKLLLCYHINHDIIRGRFPLTKELGIELASLLAQIEFGDCKSKDQNDAQTSQQLGIVMERFYPKRYRNAISREQEQRDIMENIETRWLSLKSQSQQECVRIYLNATRKWQFFGAKLFSAKLKGEHVDDVTQVWIAVLDEGISILNHSTMEPFITYPYKNIVTFGGCKDDFMLVAHCDKNTSMRRRLFRMTKFKILEITQLMATYINTRPQLPAFNTPSASQSSSRTGSQSQSHCTSRATSSTSEPHTPGTPKSQQNFSLPKASVTEAAIF